MVEVQIRLFRNARHMRRGKILIASLRARIEDMRAKGQPIDRAETVLKTFETAQRMLQDHERQLRAELKSQQAFDSAPLTSRPSSSSPRPR